GFETLIRRLYLQAWAKGIP
ncbi:unnamed protein product, partial [Allacma fusca]